METDTHLQAAVEDSGNVTRLLVRWSQGDESALEQLTPLIYGDLLRVARARMRREHGDCTLEPTALVHEAYLRMADQKKLRAENRMHFFAIAANAMRRVLIEHARKRMAQKRGGGIRITLQTGMDVAEERTPAFLLLDEALSRLSEMDVRKSKAIELKFFGGLSAEEIGQALGISVATVGRELRLGQAWIRREMSQPAFQSQDGQ
ncbi:MAG: polymerase sigma factor [Acidobacteriaceae bacterium]|nr:polymerase sigma factor [Acidobacteriaceae bacterium]